MKDDLEPDDEKLTALCREMSDLRDRGALTEEEFFRIFEQAIPAAAGDGWELEPFLNKAKPEWHERMDEMWDNR